MFDTKPSIQSEIRSLQDLYTFRVVLASMPSAPCDMLKVFESHTQSPQGLCSLPQMKNTPRAFFICGARELSAHELRQHKVIPEIFLLY